MDTNSKIIHFKKAFLIFVLLFTICPAFAQNAAVLANADALKEDNRSIAEWSVLSGTQIFTLLMILIIVQIFVVVALSDVLKNLLKSDKYKNKLKNGIKTIAVLIGISFSLHPASATATATSPSPEANSIIQLSDAMFWALITINAVLLLVIFYLLHFIKWVLREINPTVETEKVQAPWWNKFMRNMTDAVPVEEEAAVMTDHEYDGIRELDNNLPPWWVWGFYCTIVFAFVYIFHFHIFKTGDLQAAEYEKEMIRAEEEVQAYLASQADNVDESTTTLLTDEASIMAGKKIYEDNKCQQCHGPAGGGTIGPNLTDDYWLHGGNVKDIFKTIKYGVQGKTMQSWKDQITPKQMHQLSSYIKSLRGSNPSETKAPEGELYKEKVKNEKTIENDTIPVNDTLK